MSWLLCAACSPTVRPRRRVCFQLLWQFGDRLYGGKKYSHAADWFVLAAHPAFRAMAAANNAKCFRKAALCHIQQREFAQAAAIIRRCPGSDAATYYVAFLAAAHQGALCETSRWVFRRELRRQSCD